LSARARAWPGGSKDRTDLGEAHTSRVLGAATELHDESATLLEPAGVAEAAFAQARPAFEDQPTTLEQPVVGKAGKQVVLRYVEQRRSVCVGAPGSVKVD
jgi:hypothetical protein